MKRTRISKCYHVLSQRVDHHLVLEQSSCCEAPETHMAERACETIAKTIFIFSDNPLVIEIRYFEVAN